MKKDLYSRFISLLLIIISITLIITVNFETINDFMTNQQNLQYIVNIIAIISGLSGIIIGISGQRITNLEAVKEYFNQGDNEKITISREVIYGYIDYELLSNRIVEGWTNDEYKELSNCASTIINFYHMWGLMTRKKYLPIWVFKGSSGRQLIVIYEKLQVYIQLKMKDNSDYAENFSWLYKKVKRKYGY